MKKVIPVTPKEIEKLRGKLRTPRQKRIRAYDDQELCVHDLPISTCAICAPRTGGKSA